MGRKPGTVCTTCGNVGTRAEMKRDGGDGYCHKEPCGSKAAPAKIQCAISPECESQNEHGGPCIPRPPLRAERAPASPPTNRKGKPVTVASEAARSCRVCGCTAEKPCDDGAGRPCGWTSSETPASGDLCFVCADAMVLASELLDVPGAVPAEVAKRVEEDAAPCVDAARVAKILERLIAARTPTKKDRPRDTSKKRNTVTAPPAQAVLPGSEVARTLTLPTAPPVVQLPAEDRGTCSRCGEHLTRENSSRTLDGRVVHVPECAPVACPIELSLPCAACDGERGEPCAWATPEPASYVHPQRVRLLPADEQRQIATRATQDRIRALCDHYAGLASDHPMPTEAAIVRAITSDGTDAGLVADAFGAMCERGELVPHGDGAEPYYRRAPGIALVVMGRVGVKVSMLDVAKTYAEAVLSLPAGPPPEKRPEGAPPACETCDPNGGGCDHEGEPGHRGAGYDAEAREAGDSGQAFTPTPVPPASPAAVELPAALAEMEADGEIAFVDGKGCNLCGDEPSEAACSRCGRPGTLPLDDDRPSYGLDDGADELEADDRPLSPVESVLAGVREAESILVKVSETARRLLGAEVRERAAVEQLDAVQRERDELRQSAIDAACARDAAETAIRDLAEAVGATLGASPAETCVAVAKKAAADLALAKDLARLAQIEAGDRLEEKRTLRAALANLYERCGGTDVPEDDADLIAATADRVAALAGAASAGASSPAAEQAIAALAELFNVESDDLAERIRVVQLRELARGLLPARLEEQRRALADVERWTGRAHASEDGAARSQRERDTFAARVLALRAGIVATLAEPPAEPAAVDDAALVALLRGREEVPGGEPPESLDGVVAAAVHQLTGEAPPMGRGVAPLAAALGEAVRAVLAERAQADARTALDVVARLGLPPVVPTPAEPSPPARRARTFE